MLNTLIKEPKACVIAILTFALIALSGWYFGKLSNANYLHDQRQLLQSTARSQASEIERSLSFAFTSTRILAHQIEVDQSKALHFESYAKNIMASIDGIDNLQLAPNGIIKHIYPLEGNERALGLDVLHHPSYNQAAKQAIDERRMIAVGPVKLVQGGTAVISRTPIFIRDDNSQRDTFWGFASALILLEPLLINSGLAMLETEGYSVLLSRRNKHTNESQIFYRSTTPIHDSTRVVADVTLPTGSWELVLSRNLSSSLYNRSQNSLLLSLLFASIVSLGLYNILIRPRALQEEVFNKTQELQELAYNDPLTGLPNRRHLNDIFPKLLNHSVVQQQSGAFIYFDLDNFKSINDSTGHDVGDKMLQIIGARLLALSDDNTHIVRLGGDEFAILITDIQSSCDIERKARDILNTAQQPIKIEYREYKQSTSLGVALIPKHGTTTLELMQCADTALYEAKRRGKNQYAIFNEDLRNQSIHTHQQEQALDRAIQAQQLTLYFQPQLDLLTQTVVGAETLVRWKHPEKGLIFPDQFIPLAEQSGLILALGRDVIRQSFAYQARRREMGLFPIILHINLSAMQLGDDELVPFVKEMIDYYGVDGKHFGFELTETTILTDLSLAQTILQALKDLGFGIAVDDFGTGFSSLGQLKNLPVDILKIDRSFVLDLETDQDDRMMVEAIIAMAHKLRISVVAEGIENVEHLKTLQTLNCDIGQGYFIARPIPESEFNAFPEHLDQIQIP